MAQLREVDWWNEAIPAYAHGDYPGGFRSCDFCDETYTDDAHAGREIRKFYVDDAADGLCVCENCREEYEHERTA